VQKMTQAKESSSVVGNVDDQARGALAQSNEAVDHRLLREIERVWTEGPDLNDRERKR